MTTAYLEVEMEVDWEVEWSPKAFAGGPYGCPDEAHICLTSVKVGAVDILHELQTHEVYALRDQVLAEMKERAEAS